jgi:hypothetical protein
MHFSMLAQEISFIEGRHFLSAFNISLISDASPLSTLFKIIGNVNKQAPTSQGTIEMPDINQTNLFEESIELFNILVFLSVQLN